MIFIAFDIVNKKKKAMKSPRLLIIRVVRTFEKGFSIAIVYVISCSEFIK